MEISNIKVEQAKAHLSHLGYGTATNFTVQNVSVLMVSYANHQSTSQKETIERLRGFVEGRINQLKSQQENPEILDQKRIYCKLESYEEIKQLLSTTEPIDQ